MERFKIVANEKGEFIDAVDGNEVLNIAESDDYDFAEINNLGQYTYDDSFIETYR